MVLWFNSVQVSKFLNDLVSNQFGLDTFELSRTIVDCYTTCLLNKNTRQYICMCVRVCMVKNPLCAIKHETNDQLTCSKAFSKSHCTILIVDELLGHNP